MRFFTLYFVIVLLSSGLMCCDKASKNSRTGPRKLEILFLGHNSEHHNSAVYMPLLASTLSKEGINFTYTNNPDDLNAANLDKYDGLMIYANHEKITPEQEKALLGFVEKGRGFIPVHCASFCFQNSPEYISLVGGQFLNHKTDSFTAEIIKKGSPHCSIIA